MSLIIRPGTRLYSAVDSTELIAVKVGAAPVELTIGGHAALLSADERAGNAAIDGHDGGAALGKRYVDVKSSVELLCTKAGQSVPAIAGELLVLKDAKPLPSSD